MTHIGIDVSKKKLDIHILPDIKLCILKVRHPLKYSNFAFDSINQITCYWRKLFRSKNSF